jgi:intracellular multiplication protein IcmD
MIRVNIKRTLAQAFSGLALWSVAGHALAGGTAQNIGDLAKNVQGSLGPIETMIVAVCYIGGIAFAGAAIMKFKQYKDAPQQTTLGQPIALLFIAAALIWLPQIVKTTGVTIFGTSAVGEQGSASTPQGIFQ